MRIMFLFTMILIIIIFIIISHRHPIFIYDLYDIMIICELLLEIVMAGVEIQLFFKSL